MSMESFRGGFSGNERDRFFYNPDSGERFYATAYALGLDFADDGRSYLPIDFDGDGDLDIARVSLQGLRLLENTLDRGGRNFVRVALRATKTQHHALNAEVIVESDGVVQRDYVKITAGFQTQVPFELHFGLGAASKIDRVEVRWPSGAIETQADLPVNRKLSFVEGGGAPKVDVVPAWPADARPRVPDAFSLAIDVEYLDGRTGPLGTKGQPTVVNVWAPWCEPCKKELPMLAKLGRNSEGVQFVGLSVETKDRASVEASVAKYRLGYPQALANERALASLFGADGTARLPSTFVFDRDGVLRRAFYRTVEAEDLQAVLRAVADEPLNFEHLVPLGKHLAQQGKLQEALAQFDDGLRHDPKSGVFLLESGNVLAMMGRYKEAVDRLERAMKSEPYVAYGWYALGVSRKKLGQKAEALLAFERAAEIQAHPTYLDAYGAAQSNAGRLEAAAKTFERLVEVAPKSVGGWLNLGKVNARLGRPGAGAAFAKALELDPDNAAAKTLLEQYPVKR